MFGRNDKLDVGWLGGVTFFKDFSTEQLQQVAGLGQRVDAEDGAELTDQGRFGDVAYVIVDGTANVAMNGEFVTSVGAGETVGEMSLVEHRPRSATVVADGPMTLVAFGIPEFRTLLDENPTVKERVMATLDSRERANERRG